MPRFLRVFELFMVAFAACLLPAFSFEFFDELSAVHNVVVHTRTHEYKQKESEPVIRAMTKSRDY